MFNEPTGEVLMYFDYARKMLSGLYPYKDYPIVYPPLSLFFFFIPLLGGSKLYQFLFQLQILTAIILVFWLLFRLKKICGYLFLVAVIILQASPYQFVFERFDMLVAALTFLAVYLQYRKQYSWSFFVLALATMTKIYPVILLPIFKQKTKNNLLIFIGTCLLITAPFATGIQSFLQAQGGRGIEIEAVYNLFLYFIKVPIIYELASYTFAFPSWFTWPIMILGLLLAYRCKGNVWQKSFVVILAFLVTNKVLSPQFMIWLMPFFVFMSPLIIVTILISIALTSWMFSFWQEITNYQTLAFSVLLLRNFLLLAMFLYLTFPSRAKSKTNLDHQS